MTVGLRGAPTAPASSGLIADSIGLALLVVLETLGPAERLAFVSGLAAQREVVEGFFAAGRSGKFDQLVAVLHPDVVLRTDPGGTTTGGAEVAGRALMFADLDRQVRLATVNGAAGAIITVEGRPVSVMGITVVAGRVAAIDILAAPSVSSGWTSPFLD